MDRLTPIGRTFFSIALVGLGIEHFIFKDFITGRAPAWPAPMAGGLIWAYLTGIVFIIVGAAILSGKKARPAAVLAAALIFFWALLRHIPVVAADSFLSGAWTRAGKALTLVGGLLAIAATFPKTEPGDTMPLSKLINPGREFIVVGRICLGLFLVQSGIQHFMFPEFVASLIPGWFPGDGVFWAYFAGVALIAGGIGLFIPKTARLAALLSGLMVFSWFWIVHIPRAFLSVSDSIAVFEALAVSGIALVLAGSCPEKGDFPARPLSLEDDAELACLLSGLGEASKGENNALVREMMVLPGRRSPSAAASGTHRIGSCETQLSRCRASTRRLKLTIEPQT